MRGDNWIKCADAGESERRLLEKVRADYWRKCEDAAENCVR
jgi:hypothetical protein